MQLMLNLINLHLKFPHIHLIHLRQHSPLLNINMHTGFTSTPHTGCYKQHEPVNKHYMVGWSHSTLSPKLGSVDPRPVGSPNCGWLPIRPIKDTTPGPGTKPDKNHSEELESSDTRGQEGTADKFNTIVQLNPESKADLTPADQPTGFGSIASGTGVSHETGSSSSDRLAYLWQSYSSQGLSSEAADLMLASWRDKTNYNYGFSFAK